jgi:hypothetical protein
MRIQGLSPASLSRVSINLFTSMTAAAAHSMSGDLLSSGVESEHLKTLLDGQDCAGCKASLVQAAN